MNADRIRALLRPGAHTIQPHPPASRSSGAEASASTQSRDNGQIERPAGKNGSHPKVGGKSPRKRPPSVKKPVSTIFPKRKPTLDWKAETRKAKKARVPGSRSARPGMAALREIRRFQKSKDLLIPRNPFNRLVKEMVTAHKPDFRMQAMALEALQESAECWLVGLFEGQSL